MKLIPVSFAVALGLLVIAPAVATADSLGTQGYVDSVTLHDSWSDQYSTVHGEVVIREGQDANANKRTYKWGGSICQNQAISSSNARAARHGQQGQPRHHAALEVGDGEHALHRRLHGQRPARRGRALARPCVPRRRARRALLVAAT